MGKTRFRKLKNNFKNTVGYPERGRMSLINWLIHYEIRDDEYDIPRIRLNKFYIARHGFKDFIEGSVK